MSNSDELAVRDLLTAAAERQPEPLDTHQVLLRGRRRLWRNRIAPAVALVLVAMLAGGVVVVTQPRLGPPGVANTVSVVPGEIEGLAVADMRFGVAARHKDTDRDLYLYVYLANGTGGWNEVSGGGVMNQPPGPAIFFGNTQFPRVSFATLPAGSTSVEADFSEQTDSQTGWVSVRGMDGQIYVVVAVVTPTANEAARLTGLTWVDDQGQRQRYTPFAS